MKNASEKSGTENQNTHFMFDVSSKNVPFLRLLSSWTGHRWQHNKAHAHCRLDT